jgi:hypothetical protein
MLVHDKRFQDLTVKKGKTYNDINDHFVPTNHHVKFENMVDGQMVVRQGKTIKDNRMTR